MKFVISVWITKINGDNFVSLCMFMFQLPLYLQTPIIIFIQKVVPSWCSNCFFFVSYVLQKHVILAEGIISILNSRKVCFLTEPITSIRFLSLTTQMCQQNIFVPKDGYTFYAAKSRVMAVWALNNISVKSRHTFLNAITQTEEE